jgi:hypothetical protein
MDTVRKPYYVVMSGPDAGRLEYEQVPMSRKAEGNWLCKVEYAEVYNNLGVLLEPPRVVPKRLTLTQRVINGLCRKTKWKWPVRWWTPQYVPNPHFRKDAFRLPDWRTDDMIDLILRQTAWKEQRQKTTIS